MRAWFLGLFGLIISALIVFGVIYVQRGTPPAPPTALSGSADGAKVLPSATQPISLNSPAPEPSLIPTSSGLGATNLNPDLTVDTNGLSKATILLTTSEGLVKFKFYPKDAPKTVKRLIELINKGFYNGLSFHRVVPGFVVQGGDPVGNGTGGSGQRLDAEFNERRHVEGTVAMARASDPNSADSQFYISLGTFPHLDHNYTVFGQVVEGMDVVRKIKLGDKIVSAVIQ